MVNELLKQITNLAVSVSFTTRPIRPGEVSGKNYHFIDEIEFLNMHSNDDFLETADVYGHKYGTSKSSVKAEFEQGNDVILEIDWQGAEQVKNLFPKACSIFILPPSLEALTERLYKRQQDDSKIIEVRMDQAREVISHVTDADYVVVNDNFGEAVNDIIRIILSQRLRIDAQKVNLGNLLLDLATD